MRSALLLLVLVSLTLATPHVEEVRHKADHERCATGETKVVGCRIRCVLEDNTVKDIGMDTKSADCCGKLDEIDRPPECWETLRNAKRSLR